MTMPNARGRHEDAALDPEVGPDDDGTIRLSREGAVATIVLDRPRRLNAFAGEMRERLGAALQEAEVGGAEAIVIRGAGRAFSAGADVHVMAELVRRRDAREFERLLRAGAGVVRTLAGARVPVVAAVHGVAAGAGASLAAACDIRIARTDASIGFTFVRVGLHPDWGASHHLPRLVGEGTALELVLSGRIVDAAEAARIGLFDRVAPPEAFDDAVADLAAALAGAPAEVRGRVRSSLRGPSSAALEAALEREIEAQLMCFESEETQARILDFAARRDTAREAGGQQERVPPRDADAGAPRRRP